MILVDTSAWIDFFRGSGPLADDTAEAIEENAAALCGPVFTELLRGFANEASRENFRDLASGCHWLDAPGDLWEEAGELGAGLRGAGVTASTVDLLITTYALAHRVPLLTGDKDFKSIAAAGVPLVVLDKQERRPQRRRRPEK
jgi:predicted nucleic acid-binding protein